MSIQQAFEPIGHLFYIVSPNRTSFKNIEDVPNYFQSSISDLLALFFLEIIISKCLKKSSVRINDTITCLSQGILFDFCRILPLGGGLATYIYVYSNWRLVNLPWNCPCTWWISFLLIDFAYYWFHRAVHEINILWATHAVHHSSEDYNMSTNVRQSILQVFIAWILYLPLAFVMPPTMYLVHIQFNYIYQYWIHTELVRTVGPLEYILNTPSHHRVHHGANRNSIDKNFGGTLIIWDRLFGTFEPEKEEQVYGLTRPIRSFNPFCIQFEHCIYMWKVFQKREGWKNKLSVIFKGPGWSPGAPWHGYPEKRPDLKAPAKKYDPQLPVWCKLYLIWHFLILVQGYLGIMKTCRSLPEAVLCGSIVYVVFSLTCIGMFFDKSLYSPCTEFLRCLSYFVLDYCFLSISSVSLTSLQARWVSEDIIRLTFMVSFLFWLLFSPIHWKRNQMQEVAVITKSA